MTTYDVLDRTVATPVEVRVASSTLAMWLPPTEAAADILAGTGLTPLRVPGGRTPVSLGAIRYVDSDLGPYNEIALVIMVSLGDEPLPLIWQLPVNQEFTLAAGRGIWGFPKFLTTSTISVDARGGTVVELAEGDQPICSVRYARARIPAPARTMELGALSLDDEGVLRRTPFTMHTAGTRMLPLGSVQVGLGTGHPMAEQMRALELDRRQAVAVTSVSRMSATFGEPEVVPLP